MAKKRTQKMVVRKVVQQSVQVSEVEISKKLTPGNNEKEAVFIPVEEVTPQAAQSQESDQNDKVYEAEETKKEASTKAKGQEKKRKRGRTSGQEEYQI
ncbi:hypothetical protein L6164_022047 [Bauhinia variegata]|uniref:Uncharacterized protein n=1 Tax=Bauhinia variegata TaxID=167791 RepID=A0ACB9MDX0_BAUVA|nr:hypothetical protein L6164_022047 [Bauhinia variegata]